MDESKIRQDAVWDTERGELRIFGQRYTAIDAQALCSFLDSLVGVRVAEVIMHNLEYQQGKLDAAKLKAENPDASLTELIEHLSKTDRLTGVGVTKVTISENPRYSVNIEVTNPSVKGQMGAAKSFVFAWWSGALTTLLGKGFDVNGAAYSEHKNTLSCNIIQR